MAQIFKMEASLKLGGVPIHTYVAGYVLVDVVDQHIQFHDALVHLMSNIDTLKQEGCILNSVYYTVEHCGSDIPQTIVGITHLFEK